MKKLLGMGILLSVGVFGGCTSTSGSSNPNDEGFEHYHEIDYKNVAPGKTANRRERFDIKDNIGEYELKSRKVAYLPVGASKEASYKVDPDKLVDLVEYLIYENKEYVDNGLGVTGKLFIKNDSFRSERTFKTEPKDTMTDKDDWILDITHNRPFLESKTYGYQYYFADKNTVYEVSLGSLGEEGESDIWSILKYVRAKE